MRRRPVVSSFRRTSFATRSPVFGLRVVERRWSRTRLVSRDGLTLDGHARDDQDVQSQQRRVLVAIVGSFTVVMSAAAPLAARTVEHVLPSKILTPGRTNPDVKQSTIGVTICVRNWTKTVRPSTSYTNTLKLKQMQQYHEAGSPSDYEEDHFIPLELGGAPSDPKNLWPEPHSESKSSDPLETALKRKVCNHVLTLAAARRQIVTFKRTNG